MKIALAAENLVRDNVLEEAAQKCDALAEIDSIHKIAARCIRAMKHNKIDLK